MNHNGSSKADILNAVNDSLMADSARNAFPKNAQVGDQISGTITDVERRQRMERDTGRPLYWLNQKPQAEQVTSRPVTDDVLTVQTDQKLDVDDEGLRRVWIDQGVKGALRDAVGRANSKLEIGGRIDGLMLVGTDEKSRRVYNCERYVSVEATAQAGPSASYEAMAGMPPEKAAQLSKLYAQHPQAQA